MTQTMTGGCQCGQVRFEAEPPELDAYFCHCRMCQRAMGNIFASFVSLPKANVRWVTREPDYYASTSFARRGFCRECGTPLSFDYPDSGQMDLTLGAFDDTSPFSFKYHFGVESRVEAFRHVEGFPEHRASDYQPLTQRWLDHYGKFPD
jgi:hypothetical protein